METTDPAATARVRNLYLDLDRRVGRLQGILHDRVLTLHFRRELSLVLELFLYLLTVLTVAVLVSVPMLRVSAVAQEAGDDLPWFAIVRVLLGLGALCMLLLALKVGRYRRRNELLRRALHEVRRMKERLDEVPRELRG